MVVSPSMILPLENGDRIFSVTWLTQNPISKHHHRVAAQNQGRGMLLGHKTRFFKGEGLD
jgi:hypothetical protein